MPEKSSTNRLLVLSLIVLVMLSATLTANSFVSPRTADSPDLSSDDLWSDGFGFGVRDDGYSRIFSIAVLNSDVFVGGRFTNAGGKPANAIARWDGTSWSNLGGGLDNCRGVFCYPTVYALATRGNELYAGGNFLSISGVPATRVAKWDGTNWKGLGSGVEVCDRYNDCLSVLSLSTNENEVFAVGKIITDVATSGQASLDSFTKWNGAGWSPQGSITGASSILALYSVKTDAKRTYIGGVFNQAGPVSANHIASFDGAEWSSMAGGVDGCTPSYAGVPCSAVVYSIAVVGDQVLIGGAFNTAGGNPANNIAIWDGIKWSGLGDGANGPVYVVAEHNGMIYAGGDFSSIGGVQANGIARFDGVNWQALGKGVNGYVDALAFKDGDVYVGGSFDKAGGRIAQNFARWIDPTFVPPPPAPVLPKITGISVTGKRLTITGENFDIGAVLLVNSEPQKTTNDTDSPTTQLIAKKAGKKIRNGAVLQVRNSDGKVSPEFRVVN